MSESMGLVGPDVHRAQTVAAVLDPAAGELSVERLRGAPGRVVLAFVEERGRPVRAVHEAARHGSGWPRRPPWHRCAGRRAGIDPPGRPADQERAGPSFTETGIFPSMRGFCPR